VYTLAEAAARLRVSVDTIRRELRRKNLNPRRAGRQILLTDDELRALVAKRTKGEGGAA
jgi:excisionase family DNA binding protein